MKPPPQRLVSSQPIATTTIAQAPKDVPAGQILTQLKELDGACDEAMRMLAYLEGRLELILMPRDTIHEPEQPEPPVLVPLAERLRRIVNHVQAFGKAIDVLVGRIEL
jgi:hypothetical protein